MNMVGGVVDLSGDDDDDYDAAAAPAAADDDTDVMTIAVDDPYGGGGAGGGVVGGGVVGGGGCGGGRGETDTLIDPDTETDMEDSEIDENVVGAVVEGGQEGGALWRVGKRQRL